MDPAFVVLESLRRWGVFRTPTHERAAEAFLRNRPKGPAPLVDAPRPGPDGSLEFSPRLSLLLAEALELKPQARVLLPPVTSPLLRHLVEKAGSRLFDPLRDATADRALELSPAARRAPLADEGFALRLSFEPFQEGLSKRVRSEGSEVTIGLENLKLEGETGPRQTPSRSIRHLLVLEGFCRRALRGRTPTQHDHLFATAVQATWDPAAARERLDEARRLFHLAYVHQFVGDWAGAIDLYLASLDVVPTAEAHTFLGWVRSFEGDLAAAIEACKAAITVDPDFGNPYNDIGAYLLELGRPDEALPWLRKALRAPRYDAPHFAHCNVGRGLLSLGRVDEAARAFEAALRLQPDYPPAQEHLRRLRERGPAAGPRRRPPR